MRTVRRLLPLRVARPVLLPTICESRPQVFTESPHPLARDLDDPLDVAVRAAPPPAGTRNPLCELAGQIGRPAGPDPAADRAVAARRPGSRTCWRSVPSRRASAQSSTLITPLALAIRDSDKTRLRRTEILGGLIREVPTGRLTSLDGFTVLTSAGIQR